MKVEPEDLLDWDAPLSQQSEKVKAALASIGTPRITSSDIEQMVRYAKSEHYQKRYAKNNKARQEYEALFAILKNDGEAAAIEWIYSNPELEPADGILTFEGKPLSTWAPPDGTGREIYHDLVSELGSIQDRGKIASAALAEAGIPGIRYLDGGSRTAGEGSRNVVMFPGTEDRITIVDDGEALSAIAPVPAHRGIEPDITSVRKETEEEWQENEGGIGEKPFVQRTVDGITELKNGSARHWIALPNEPEYAELMQELVILETAPSKAKGDIIRYLKSLYTGLNPYEMRLVTRKAILDDLAWEVKQEHLLPYGYTPETLLLDRIKIDAALEQRPDLQKIVRARKSFTRLIANQLVEAGVLNADQIKNPAYYRHQVMDYVLLMREAAAGRVTAASLKEAHEADPALEQDQVLKNPLARAQVLKNVEGKATGPAAKARRLVGKEGARIRTPKWAQRHGSSRAINANMLEAEFDWLFKAMVDIKTAKLLTWVKEHYKENLDAARDTAKAGNAAGMRAVLDRDMAEHGIEVGMDANSVPIRSSPKLEIWKGFRRDIAIGLSKVRAAVDDLGTVPKHLQPALARLTGDPEEEASIFNLLSWMIDNEKPGAMGAMMVLKATGRRRAWVKDQLGKKYVYPDDIKGLVAKGLAPVGHVAWQPDEGRVLFTAKSIPEHVIDGLLKRIAADDEGTGLSKEALLDALNQIRPMLAVGGDKYTMILPAEVAATLDGFGDTRQAGLFAHAVEGNLRGWKVWRLLNPHTVVRYRLNNFSGDLDATIAGNPRAILKLRQATGEVIDVMYRGKSPSKRYDEAIEMGVFDAGLTVQEIPDINKLEDFARTLKPKSPLKKLVGVPMVAWRMIQKNTWMQESLLRYSAYLDYVERLEGGESMKSIGYGASLPKMIDAVTDPRKRAALLARDLIGDYGRISAYGASLRRYIIPFWSWMEINPKRYWRLSINAYSQGVGEGFRASSIIGAGMGIRLSAYLYLRMAVLYGLVSIWNNLRYPDIEDELDDDERWRLHLTLGRDEDGNIITLRFQGAFSDALAWFGLEDAAAAIADVNRGRAGVHDVMLAIAKAAPSRIINGITPVIMMPAKYLSGQNFWPDVFNPRQSRDPWRDVAQTIALENEYDALFNRPSRGYGNAWIKSLVSKKSPGENAYNRIRGAAYEWIRRERGTEGSGSQTTPRSQALYDYKKALRYGDESAARAAQSRMDNLGMTSKDKKASLKRAEPLGPVPRKDRRRFEEQLDAKELRLLKRAEVWYEETMLERRP